MVTEADSEGQEDRIPEGAEPRGFLRRQPRQAVRVVADNGVYPAQEVLVKLA